MKKFIVTFLIFISVIFSTYSNNSNPNRHIVNYVEVISDITYPFDAREKGIEGTVVVKLHIGKNNDLVNYKFVDYPCETLKLIVEQAIQEFKFKSKYDENGKPVESVVLLPITFKLT